MTYVIEVTNGEIVELSSLADVKQWVKDNGYVTEHNAKQRGIDETITSQGDVCIYEKGNESDRIDGRIRWRNIDPIKIVAFNKSDEELKLHAARGVQRAIDSGRMTEEDGELIKNFVTQLKAEQNIGAKRAYKITNSLSNASRFFKTPFKKNSIYDIYEGMDALKTGTSVKWVEKGIEDTKKPLSPNTIRDYQMFIKRFYLWLIDENLCDAPEIKVKNIKLVKPNRVTKCAEDLLSEEQIRDMLNACQTSRDRALISVLYEGAFRIGEIAGLMWSDVDFSDKHFCMISTNFKTGIERHIPIHTARPYLVQWKNDYPGDASGNNPVFVSRHKTSLKYSAIRFQLNAIAKRTGIQKHITPHIFRHSRITHMIKDGWTDSTVKSIAWGNLETGMFETYVHLTEKDILTEARKRNGVEAPSEETPTEVMKARQCPRCFTLNGPTINFCSVCGAPLTEAIALSLEDLKQEIHGDERYKKVVGDLERKAEAMELFS